MRSDTRSSPELMAARFLAAHQAEYLQMRDPRLVHRCALHLVDLLNISMQRAQALAEQEAAAMAAARCTAWVDLGQTTSRVVVVRDPARRLTLTLGVDQLLAMADQL